MFSDNAADTVGCIAAGSGSYTVAGSVAGIVVYNASGTVADIALGNAGCIDYCNVADIVTDTVADFGAAIALSTLSRRDQFESK